MAFAPENNKKAFEKTGVHPFNHSVIKSEDLALSLEHSKHATPPIQVSEPVERFLNIFHQMIMGNDEKEIEIGADNDEEIDLEGINDSETEDGDNVQHQTLFSQGP